MLGSFGRTLGLALMTFGGLLPVPRPVRGGYAAGAMPGRPVPPISSAPARMPARGGPTARREQLHATVEPQVRQLVTDQLGVDAADLTAEVSLTDELAADSLDMVELVLVLEDHFSMTVAEDRIDEIRTYRDLLDTVVASLAARDRRELGALRPLPVKARIIPPGRSRAEGLERADELTPYAVQIIGEDAMHAGWGARLEVTVAPTCSETDMAVIRTDFGWLRRRGIEVSVRRVTDEIG